MADITPLYPDPHPEFLRGLDLVPTLARKIMTATRKHVGIHTATMLSPDDRPVMGWCVHVDPESDMGCRRYELYDALAHVLEEHADGGNCGE